MPLKSIAIQVCRLEAMVAFYSEAFGVRFEEAEVAGMRAFFGTWDELEIKLGVETDRPGWVRERCAAHGGRLEDPGAT